MKPGEQLVLVIFGNLEIFTLKNYLEFQVQSKIQLLCCLTPLPEFYCVAVDGSLAQPVLPPVALRPAQQNHLSHQQRHQKRRQHHPSYCLQFRPTQSGTIFSLDDELYVFCSGKSNISESWFILGNNELLYLAP